MICAVIRTTSTCLTAINNALQYRSEQPHFVPLSERFFCPTDIAA